MSMMNWAKIVLKAHYREILLVALILGAGAVVRLYHFAPWLHFEVDQVYDIASVGPALEQLGSLPLLGPVAAGGPLRLGPVYYYLQFLSASIFGNSPAGHAAFVPILSIAALLLFYLIARRYLSRTAAFLSLALFAGSFYAIQYARFSWNPNVLPFFLLLIMGVLLKYLHGDPAGKQKSWWLLMTLIGITLQLHFNALFVLLPVVLTMLVFKWAWPDMRTFVIGAMLFTLTFLPVIAHEIVTKGSNTALLTEKIMGASPGEVDDQDETRASLPERGFQTIVRYGAYEGMLIVSGYDAVNDSRPTGYSLGLHCKSCATMAPFRKWALLMYAVLLGLLVFRFWKERKSERGDFFLILILWLFYTNMYFTWIFYQGLYLYPRFYLLIVPVVFFLTGILFDTLIRYMSWLGVVVSVAVSVALIWSNAQFIRETYELLRSAPTSPIEVETEDIFPHRGRITLEQQEVVVDFILAKQKESRLPIYLASESEYEPAFWYHFDRRSVSEFHHLYPGMNEAFGYHVVVTRTASKLKKGMAAILAERSDWEMKDFGSLRVYMAVAAGAPASGIDVAPSSALEEMQPLRARFLPRWNNLLSLPKQNAP